MCACGEGQIERQEEKECARMINERAVFSFKLNCCSAVSMLVSVQLEYNKKRYARGSNSMY